MRLGLSNLFMPVSYGQFVRLTFQFKQAVQESTGVPFDLEIKLMSRTKEYISIIDDSWQESLDEQNKAATIATVTSLSDLTPELWKQARYVEVSMRPQEGVKDGPPSAWAHMEAKGALSRAVTFYAQPDCEDVAIKMTRQNRMMCESDGFDGNSSNILSRPGMALLGLSRRY